MSELKSLESQKLTAEEEEKSISVKISEAGGEHKELQKRLEKADADSEARSEEFRNASSALAKAEKEKQATENKVWVRGGVGQSCGARHLQVPHLCGPGQVSSSL